VLAKVESSVIHQNRQETRTTTIYKISRFAKK